VFLAYALLAGLVGLYGLAGNASFLPAGWLEAFDPLRPLALALDGTDPAGAFRRLGAFAVAWGGLGLAAAALAVWRLRPAYQRQIDARPRRLQLTIQAARPAPGDDALAWKECYVGQRLPTWLGLPLIAVVTAGVTYDALTSALVPRVENLMTIGCGALIVLTVYVSVRASGTISGERERQTWDGLLLTPLTVRQIVRGKLTEILKSAWQYLFTFWFSVAITALVLAPFSTSKAGVEFVAGLVVWLAVVAPAVYFAAAAGLYRSACSQSSWRSLLATLAINYVGGFVLFFFSTLLAWVGILLIGGLLTLFSNPGWTILGAMFWLAVVGYVYWLAARVFIDGAERQVALSERIRPESLIGFDTPYRLARPVQHQRL
jgi:hypothetical protein